MADINRKVLTWKLIVVVEVFEIKFLDYTSERKLLFHTQDTLREHVGIIPTIYYQNLNNRSV